MKLKSLLIGSAAVLAASSAARAADAIIVEPEPVEYVRVCDMYGTGFFYIPGTETCINFNGYVRSTYATGHAERDVKETTFGRAYTFSKGAWSVYTPIYGYTTSSLVQVGQWYTPFFGFPYPVFDTEINSVAGLTRPVDSKSDWHSWTYRARFNIDVRNETEYGTLRSEIRFQAGDTNTQDGAVGVDRALISLAGFRLGYSDTYWTTNHGYGAGSPAINDGFINYDQAIFFDYTWSNDNFAVTVGVQDSSSGGSFAGANGYADFYAGVNWKSDWGTFAFTALHDSQAASLDYQDGFFTDYLHWQREDAWVYKASAIIPLGDSGWEVGGWYAWSENPYTRYITAYGLPNPGLDNEWGVQVNGKLTDNLSAYALYTAASGEAEVDAYTTAGVKYGSGSISDNHSEMWVVGAVWTPVNQLSVQVEYSSRTATSKTKNTLYGNAKITDTEDGVAIRVTRSF